MNQRWALGGAMFGLLTISLVLLLKWPFWWVLLIAPPAILGLGSEGLPIAQQWGVVALMIFLNILLFSGLGFWIGYFVECVRGK